MEREAPARILIVEDEPTLAHMYGRALSLSGHRVDQAADGMEGLKALLSVEYDLVVSDIRMPGMSGLDLLDKARRLRPDLPFVLMTAQLDVQLYGRAREMGVVRYLLKPVKLDQLTRAVENGLKVRAVLLRRQERKLRNAGADGRDT
ncbi:MAG TPA: response regulator [Polyangiaceae bacterium]|jgi:DNA-binding NtrC family response regulator|nr:response regulator [Polyangiaceae bacterium]